MMTIGFMKVGDQNVMFNMKNQKLSGLVDEV